MFSASAAYRAQTQVLICGGAAVVEGEYQIVVALISSGFLTSFGFGWVLVLLGLIFAGWHRWGASRSHRKL